MAGRATTPTGSTPQSGNPFAPTQQQQTFGPVGGFTFGATQDSQPSETGMQASANGFTFSAGQPDSNPFTNVQLNNPFASTNGAISSSFPPTNGNFGGSSTNIGKRSSDDMMMESPEKKQAGTHAFGRHQGFNWANPSQPQQQQPAPAPLFSFASSQQNNNQPNGGLLGSVSKLEQPQQNNLFGPPQSSQPLFSGFGQPTQTTSAPPSFSFEQKEQTPTPPPSFSTSFGQNTSNQQSEAPKFSFGATAATQASGSPLLFGQTSTTQKTTDAPLFGSKDSSRATSPFKLGDTLSEPSTSANPFADIKAPAPVRQYSFGQPVEDSASEKPEDPKPASSLFGSNTAAQSGPVLFSQATPTQPTPNLFGPSSSSPKPTPVFNFGQPTRPEPSPNDEKPAEAPKNPFAHIPNPSASTGPPLPSASTGTDAPKSAGFSFAPPSKSSAGSLGSSTTTAHSSNLFGLSKTSQAPTTSLFGSPRKASEAPEVSEAAEASQSLNKEQDSAPTKPVFSFGSTQPPSSGGLFTPGKPTATDKVPTTEPVKAPFFGGGPPLIQKDPAPAPEPATEKPKKQLFGRTLDSNSTSSQAAAPESAVKAPLFGALQAVRPSATETNENLASSLTESPAFKSAAKSQAFPSTQSTSTETSSQRPVYTKSPGRIPNFLNGEGYKEYDNNFRLRALNREFQRRLAALDPSRHDFENIIRHYVAARASIGADIGLYQRTMAGTKRKNDTIDEQELEVPQQYKKTKSNDGQASAPAPSQPVVKTNTFKTTKAVAQTFTSSAPPASKATSMFSQMIPKSPGKTFDAPKQTASEKPTNVFASIPNPPPAGPSFIRNLVEEIENSSAPKSSGAPTFGNRIPSEAPANPPQGVIPFSAPSSTPVKPPQGFVPSTMPAKPPQGFVPASAPPSDLFAAFADKAAKNEKKRKAEILEDQYSSDEDSQAEGRKKLEEAERAKRAKFNSIPKTGFTPNFQKSTSPSKSPPTSSFIPRAASVEKPTSPAKSSPTKAKRKSPFEASDSDEDADDKEGEADDEETTEEKDGEFQPVDEESTEEDEEGEEEEDDLPEDEVQEENEDDDIDHEAEIEANPNKGKSLFDRIEANPEKPNDTPVNGDKNVRKSIESGFNFSKKDDPILGSAKRSSFKPTVWGSHIGKSTPDAPAFSPITPATTSSFKPATTFSFTTTPATTTPTPVPGASVLSGGLTAGSYSKFDGMFGSRPTTPNPTDKEPPAPATSSGPVNHTWTAGSPIKFGETPEKAAAPKIAVTEASPEKAGETTPKAPAPSPFGSLFGTTPASTFKPGDTSSGFSFGAGKLDFLSAKRPLETASGLTSGISSRGTSPGLTDAESVQTDASDAMPPEPQANLSDSRAGEENEDCLFEAKSKALKFVTEEAAKGTKSEPNTWETQGVGMFRLLRDKETGKCRVLFRAEPGGNIIVNANLLPTMEYASIPQGNSGAVKGPLYSDKKKTLERWVFKLKTKDMAVELECLMKEHQKN